MLEGAMIVELEWATTMAMAKTSPMLLEPFPRAAEAAVGMGWSVKKPAPVGPGLGSEEPSV